MGFLKKNIRSAPQAARKLPARPSSDQLWSMPLQPGHHSQILKPARLRWSREGQRDLCQMTTNAPEMISTLGWDTLQKRRDLARLSMMYRIVHHLVDIPVEPYLTPSTGMTRGHDSRFFQIRTSNTTYQQSFFPRTVILWNQLPQNAVSQTTLEAFQNQLATQTL